MKTCYIAPHKHNHAKKKKTVKYHSKIENCILNCDVM